MLRAYGGDQDLASGGVAYGRVVSEGEAIFLQYWLFYPDNPCVLPPGRHDGDWELVQVRAERGGGDFRPTHLTLAEHGKPVNKSISSAAEIEVFVAVDSHACYFKEGANPIIPLSDVCEPAGTPSGKPDIVLPADRGLKGRLGALAGSLGPRSGARHLARPAASSQAHARDLQAAQQSGCRREPAEPWSPGPKLELPRRLRHPRQRPHRDDNADPALRSLPWRNDLAGTTRRASRGHGAELGRGFVDTPLQVGSARSGTLSPSHLDGGNRLLGRTRRRQSPRARRSNSAPGQKQDPRDPAPRRAPLARRRLQRPAPARQPTAETD